MEPLFLLLLIPLVFACLLLWLLKTLGQGNINHRRARRSSDSGAAFSGDAGASSGSEGHSSHDSGGGCGGDSGGGDSGGG